MILPVSDPLFPSQSKSDKRNSGFPFYFRDEWASVYLTSLRGSVFWTSLVIDSFKRKRKRIMVPSRNKSYRSAVRMSLFLLLLIFVSCQATAHDAPASDFDTVTDMPDRDILSASDDDAVMFCDYKDDFKLVEDHIIDLVGKTFFITVSGIPEEYRTETVWESDNSETATVDSNGNVQLLAPGYAVITASYCEETHDIDVTSVHYSLLSAQETYDLIMDHETDNTFHIIDVRTPGEFENGHLSDAMNYNYYSNFEDGISTLDPEEIYLVYCASGSRSSGAVSTMMNADFIRLYELETVSLHG